MEKIKYGNIIDCLKLKTNIHELNNIYILLSLVFIR